MNSEGQQEYWQHEGGDAEPALGSQDAPASMEPLENTTPEPEDEQIRWQASEYIHHEKHALWFVILAGATLVLMAIAFFLIHSITFTILLAVMAVAVIVIASRPPRVLNYQLDHHMLLVDEKHFSLRDFRAFGVVEDGPFYSVTLIPHKRFMPAVNVYFPAEEGEKIVDIFGEVLPMEHVEPDIIDRAVRKLRF